MKRNLTNRIDVAIWHYRWGWPTPPAFPRVARGSQPWASGRNPFGILGKVLNDLEGLAGLLLDQEGVGISGNEGGVGCSLLVHSCGFFSHASNNMARHRQVVHDTQIGLMVAALNQAFSSSQKQQLERNRPAKPSYGEGAGMAGWLGETTIIAIPHHPTPPHSQRES